MSKDRETIFIKSVNINSLSNDELWTTYYKDNFKDKFKHRINYYTYGAKVCNMGIFYVSYLRYSPTYGDLSISFSVSKMYNGNNSIAKSNIVFNDLIQRIFKGLEVILYTNKLPPPDTWMISKDETNIDIVDTIDNLKRRFELLKKVEIPYRRLDYSLAHKGTLYFHSGKDRKKSSAAIIIYYKVREQNSRNEDIHEVMNLNDECEVLRIEVKYKGAALKRRVKKMVKLNELYFKIVFQQTVNLDLIKSLKIDYKDLNLENFRGIDQPPINNFQIIYKEIILSTCSNLNLKRDYDIIPPKYPSRYTIYQGNKALINIVMSKNYQIDVINDFIVSCKFDKKIITRNELLKVIDKSDIFSNTTKNTARKIIKYLNKEIKTISISEKTIRRYKKLILKTGYHYLYSDVPLEPIKLEDIAMIIDQDKSVDITA